MKKTTVFIIAIILFSLNGIAQITKGNWMVGGDGNFSRTYSVDSNGNESIKTFYINLKPKLGYFFVDKLVGGLQANYFYNKSPGIQSSSIYGLSPFLRYYFLKADNRVNLLTQFSYGYLTIKSQNGKSYYEQGYSFKTGPVIYFNSSVGLEITVNYDSTFQELTKNKNYNLSIGMGIQVHLEK
jgi:hypothetical protein